MSGYATSFVRQALLNEYHRLKSLLITDRERETMAAIEKPRPVEQMDHEQLCSYIDLLHRSVRKNEHENTQVVSA